MTNDQIVESLNVLAKNIHQMNCDKGFWEADKSTRNRGELIALMHSELSEALEADRKKLMDDKVTHRDGFSVELADCLIRILDTCGAYDIPIGTIIFEKLEYNQSRPYKHGKNY